MQLVSIPGPIVSISSNQEQFFYTYHRGQGFEGNQNLSGGIISMEKNEAKTIPENIALSPQSTLVWAGFTDEGSPATYDSDGIVRIGKSTFEVLKLLLKIFKTRFILIFLGAL